MGRNQVGKGYDRRLNGKHRDNRKQDTANRWAVMDEYNELREEIAGLEIQRRRDAKLQKQQALEIHELRVKAAAAYREGAVAAGFLVFLATTLITVIILWGSY